MSNQFFLKVIEARGLRSADAFSPSDPYCIVELKGHLFNKEKQYTKVIWDNNNPIWNEDFVMHPSKPQDIIIISIYDKDKITSDDFLGKIELPVAQYLNRGPIDEWRPLTTKHGKSGQGEVHILTRYGASSGSLSSHGQQSMQSTPMPKPSGVYQAPPSAPPSFSNAQAQPYSSYPAPPSGYGNNNYNNYQYNQKPFGQSGVTENAFNASYGPNPYSLPPYSNPNRSVGAAAPAQPYPQADAYSAPYSAPYLAPSNPIPPNNFFNY
eukprot:TRINITY_DN1637_c0_g1_i2.p1 TRINITY_DN1637_c0_g1~~TRINITY_DN1637_c0_g1_i2.p1  ORF type:complete len:273 (-),score=53.64 TRINITY_DN1637_c0_g1_i2:53-850(-)